MSPDAYCQEKAAQSGSSFYYSFLFLPPPRRAAITALYAFCREIDDTVDEIEDHSVAAARLTWWRGELKQLYAGAPTHPVTRALQPHLATYDIREQHLAEIIDGMEMDLHQTRYLDFSGLARYCHLAAGVVGLLAARIFGATQDATLQYAERLGLAFQLTNIIRDVGEDARMGRIYLPMDELRRFEVPAAEILKGQYSERFTALMRFQAERARRAYDEAFALLPEADRRNQRAGLIMAGIYGTLLREIEASNFQVLHQRITLTPLRKLWIAWRIWVRATPPTWAS